MEGTEQDTMDGGRNIERAVALGSFNDAQRLRARHEGTGAHDGSETLRAGRLSMGVGALAEGASNPRLIETAVMRTAP